ncbi:ABC transporter ATP-binding protein [bacterium]|nr:ABC transporter ATP-binding protein [Planktomarina temperata]MDC0094506.1 ABC transporter ATP-binding protein [bacterium]
MAEIELKNIAHSYNPQAADMAYALDPFDMTWVDGGRYAILGPSGCGKTTMLNIMSGIVQPSEGKLLFDGVDVTTLSTSERNIAQVFQFPVIYGTMTVEQNLAFPLVCRNYEKSVIDAKVLEVAEALSLQGLLKKSASRLTADQKQLISLGRGLVRDDVAAVLMDEPLTVIDPDLKFRLRRQLKEINQKYRSTLIYVTHDQNEAMTFAENIIVMDAGKIVQVGSPAELFDRPKTTFVGYFIGAPAMNFFNCQAVEGNKLSIGSAEIMTSTDLSKVGSAPLKLGIRSEYIRIVETKGVNTFTAQVQRVEDLGNYKLMTAVFDGYVIKVKVERDIMVPAEHVELRLPAENCCVYAADVLVS